VRVGTTRIDLEVGMTKEEFEFWEKAFLAAMQGISAGVGYDTPAYVTRRSSELADAALAVWREKRRELHMPEVKNADT